MSECKHMLGIDFVMYEGWGPFYEKPLDSADEVRWFDYCPHCGAKLTPPLSNDGAQK